MDLNQLQKRPYNHSSNLEDDYSAGGSPGSPPREHNNCRKKRRRKSDLGSSCDDSSQKKRPNSRCFDFVEDPEIDEDGLPVSLRAIGKAPSFKEE